MPATLAIRLNLGAIPLKIAQELKDPAIVRELQQRAIAATAPFVQAELMKATPVGATAMLRQSVIILYSPMGTIAFVGPVGGPSLYAGFVVTGTRPHWPPRDAIEYWAARKFGYPLGSPAARSAGYLVARKIAQQGTEANEYVLHTADRVQPRVRHLMANVIGEYFATLTGEAQIL